MEPITLVLLPGLDGTGLLFKPFVAALPSSLPPQIVSYPGDVPLSYDALLSRIMPALPRDRPFVLLGESFSGPLALRAAQQRPPGLRAVVLCATFVSNPVRWIPSAAGALIHPAVVRLAPLALIRRLFTARGIPPALSMLAREAQAQVSSEVLALRAREALAVHAERSLQECPVPLLYLQASRDALVGPHNLKKMLRLRPDTSVSRIDGPHWLLQTQPNEAVNRIVEFLERTMFDQQSSTR